MSVIETTIYTCGPYDVSVSGSTIRITQRSNGTVCIYNLDRANAREISDALRRAADIVRSPRKRKPARIVDSGPRWAPPSISDLDPNEH